MGGIAEWLEAGPMVGHGSGDGGGDEPRCLGGQLKAGEIGVRQA
jgi:hypothetical protein